MKFGLRFRLTVCSAWKLATLQVFRSYVWLVAPTVGTAGLEERNIWGGQKPMHGRGGEEEPGGFFPSVQNPSLYC